MIHTPRLTLIPARAEILLADVDGRESLGRVLGVRVPDSWPPDLYDDGAILWTLERLESGGPGTQPFWTYYFVWTTAPGVPELVGVGGFKGPPEDGRVELGYSVVRTRQRRGFATEAVRGMLEFAFSHDDVDEVIAETLPDLVSSIGVLEKSGFRLEGAGSEPGVIRFSISREAWRRAAAPERNDRSGTEDER